MRNKQGGFAQIDENKLRTTFALPRNSVHHDQTQPKVCGRVRVIGHIGQQMVCPFSVWGN